MEYAQSEEAQFREVVSASIDEIDAALDKLRRGEGVEFEKTMYQYLMQVQDLDEVIG